MRLAHLSSLSVVLFAAFLAACDEDATGGGGGAGGDDPTGTTASATSGTPSGSGPTSATGATAGSGGAGTASGGPTSGPSTVTAGPGGSTGAGEVEPCDGVDPDSLYAQTAIDFLTNDPVNLCDYRGQVIMIVNIASQCGYTYQMADLQYLQETFAADGFHLLGFLSNDFGSQAGTQEQIEACNAEHHVTFQEYAIAPVATSPQPVFAWLQAQPNPGPDDSLVPSWNFNKYVISKDGRLVGKYDESEAWGTDSTAPAFDASPAVQKVREALAE